MWEQYGDDDVAVSSRYELFKAALEGLLDEAHLGLVRYGTDPLRNTFNMKDQFKTSEMIDVIEVSYRVVNVRQQKYACTCGGCVETAPASGASGREQFEQ